MTKNQTNPILPQVVLGSTSPFRKALLDKLHIPFIQDSPDIDEHTLDT